MNFSVEEPLPQKPYDLPQIAPHLLQRVGKNEEGTRVKTTIDYACKTESIKLRNIITISTSRMR
jgi:membrane carboxypeptidase/penicillin-binding protein PbpC